MAKNGQEAWPFVEQAMSNTLVLVGSAVAVSLVAGLCVGTLSAVRQGSLLDHAATAVSFLGISIPVFWLGLMLQLFFGLYLAQWPGVSPPLLPTAGVNSPGTVGFDAVDRIRHLVLPALALSILGLLPRNRGRVVAGEALLAGENLLEASPERMRQVRGAEIAMIFQEPLTALNPVYRVGDRIAEMIRAHQPPNRSEARRRAAGLLDRVGIPDATRRARPYPHEPSGGMRRRVMIAMAIAPEPAVLIADEPTTALDATVQAQVLDLLSEVQRGLRSAMLLITHDLGVVGDIADRVVVMHAGPPWSTVRSTTSSKDPAIPTPKACSTPCHAWTAHPTA
ncbi:MAG: ATP-binding cassette domain-containing protein [bacterium]|nr:ATP-binding cassette domain-containing protein [bacterium]